MTRSNSLTENKDFLSTLLSLFSEHTVDTGEKFWLCHFQTKRKKKDFLFAGKGPNLCCCARDLYRLLGAPAQSGLWICVLHHPGEANCWQVERSGW